MTYPDLDLIACNRDWFTNRRGFITGATGWIGSWICQALDRAGARYISLKHTRRENIDNFRIPDLKIDYIIHLAPGGVKRVIECAQQNRIDSILFSSSGAVYVMNNAYAAKKKENEEELIQSGLPVKIARIFTLAGPGAPLYSTFALSSFIGQALNNKPLAIWSDGKAIRTYIYMTDLITWLFTILIEGKDRYPYDVGGEEEISIWQLAREVRNRFDKQIDIIIENRSIDATPDYVPDLDRIKELGCRIQVPLKQALDKTVEYYQREYEI